jgi:hypothetical protein
MTKIPTPKEVQAILRELTPAQRPVLAALESDVFALHSRSQFRLIRGGRQENLTARMNSLASEFAMLKPNDPGRAEIVKEISRLSLLSNKSRTKDG